MDPITPGVADQRYSISWQVYGETLFWEPECMYNSKQQLCSIIATSGLGAWVQTNRNRRILAYTTFAQRQQCFPSFVLQLHPVQLLAYVSIMCIPNISHSVFNSNRPFPYLRRALLTLQNLSSSDDWAKILKSAPLKMIRNMFRACFSKQRVPRSKTDCWIWYLVTP